MGCKCCDGHCCHHEETENINYKLLVFKILVGILALIIGHFFENVKYVSLVVTIVAYAFVSYDIFFEAFKELKDGEVFSEYLLMIIATIGAFFIGEYHESVMVMLLFIVGELLQGKAVRFPRPPFP
jgi:Cd2+/Zn2+-exporting ATPase